LTHLSDDSVAQAAESQGANHRFVQKVVREAKFNLADLIETLDL
jgi:hypothetical protein